MPRILLISPRSLILKIFDNFFLNQDINDSFFAAITISFTYIIKMTAFSL